MTELIICSSNGSFNNIYIIGNRQHEAPAVNINADSHFKIQSERAKAEQASLTIADIAQHVSLSLSLSKLPSCVILLSTIFPFLFHALSFRLSIELIHHPILYGSDVKYLGTKAVSVFRSPGKALQVNNMETQNLKNLKS